MTFAEKLKKLRTKNEYSQEQLADMLNVSRQAITKWETGKGMPDIENLKAIADLFDVTLDSLVREEEELETTDESACWHIASAGMVVGLVIGWLLQTESLDAKNIGAWGIGGGVIGYVLAYIFMIVKKKS
ncbi:helix-turn-helix domain-containing protein [Anaerovorax odorimutans]|uniref:Helix-turn-helix domain-containing protein n=1 Tax=Anaerovorax odorimutans TaxID=109327 RepID=A0ABT1RQ20_9FIRM|nr:helix-turn-helix transcriptional regulator [Anaerovorax odorimutans]MCQ4637296.1 helix-turn-helix domain-containing protein [Anaerovorax odorimutans]